MNLNYNSNDHDNDDVYHLSNSNRHKLYDIDVRNDDDVFNSTSSIQRHRDASSNKESSLISQQCIKGYSDKLINSNPYNKFRIDNIIEDDIEDDSCRVMSNQTFQLQSQRQLPVKQHNDDDHD